MTREVRRPHATAILRLSGYLEADDSERFRGLDTRSGPPIHPLFRSGASTMRRVAYVFNTCEVIWR